MTLRRSGYQSLGNGVYRVNGAVRRSAVTGRFVNSPERTASPDRSMVRNPRAEVAERAARNR